MKSPKASNLETFKLLVFDLYLHSQKNAGKISGNEIRDKFRAYKIDTHYTKKALLTLGIINEIERGPKKVIIYQWSGGIPTEEMAHNFLHEVYMIRHIDQEGTRLRRIAQRKALKELKMAGHRVDEAQQSFEQAVEEHIEQQVSPTLDSWCLKFPDEKQYFSAFGLEMMRKIGRLFSIESVKELDGH